MKPKGRLQRRGEMAAVCCHFNPTISAQRIRNYERFRRLIERSGLPLLTVELAFPGAPFDLPPGRDVIQVRGGDIMWQKERLLQLGAERALDEGCGNIVFLDTDVIFGDDDWPRQVRRCLESTPVLQCFSKAIRNFTDVLLVQTSTVRNVLEKREDPNQAMGISWAITADIFEQVGLYQHCIVGGGDTAFAFAALGLADGDARRSRLLQNPSFMSFAGRPMNSHYMNWADRLYRATEGRCGYIDQTVFTLSHGTRGGRNYILRHRILEDFDPEREVAVDSCGAFVWTKEGRARAGKVRDYFQGRGEDAG